MTSLVVGDQVQTPLGKAVVAEIRRGGRVVVTIGNRHVVLAQADVVQLQPRVGRARRASEGARREAEVPPDEGAGMAAFDLHGCTVEDALERTMAAIDAALRDGWTGMRIIHGRHGGRIRAAVHARLRQLPPVRRFHLDPANPGVTIVEW